LVIPREGERSWIENDTGVQSERWLFEGREGSEKANCINIIQCQRASKNIAVLALNPELRCTITIVMLPIPGVVYTSWFLSVFFRNMPTE
jgi:hypothetical protein